MVGRVAIPEQWPQNHHGWHGDDLEKILEVCVSVCKGANIFYVFLCIELIDTYRTPNISKVHSEFTLLIMTLSVELHSVIVVLFFEAFFLSFPFLSLFAQTSETRDNI